MKTFKEYLEEGRDAPLYHGTGSAYALAILKDNAIKPFKTHGATVQLIKKDDNVAVSLTRSIKTAIEWRNNGLAFELNQRKLAQNYQIKPLNINYHWTGGRSSAKHEQLFEEYVTKPIQPLTRYLEKIIVDEGGYNDIKWNYELEYRDEQTTAKERAKWEVLFKHPLLYSYEKKRFIIK